MSHSSTVDHLLILSLLFRIHRDAEEAEYDSRKLTKAALRQLTAGERELMIKTKKEVRCTYTYTEKMSLILQKKCKPGHRVQTMASCILRAKRV